MVCSLGLKMPKVCPTPLREVKKSPRQFVVTSNAPFDLKRYNCDKTTFYNFVMEISFYQEYYGVRIKKLK